MSCRFILLLGQSNRGGVCLVLGSVSYFKRGRRELCDLRPHYRLSIGPHYRSPYRFVPPIIVAISVPIIIDCFRRELCDLRPPLFRPHYRAIIDRWFCVWVSDFWLNGGDYLRGGIWNEWGELSLIFRILK